MGYLRNPTQPFPQKKCFTSIMRLLFAITFLLISHSIPWAQNSFMKTFGTTNSDYGTACIQTEDYGSLLLTTGGVSNGSTVQFGVVKTTYDGTLEWQKVFQLGSHAIAADAVLSEGGYCIVGSVGGSLNNRTMFLMQLDPSGNEIWKYQYDLGPNGHPIQLIKCANGDLLCLLTTNYNTGGSPSGMMVRLNPSGDVLWSRIYAQLNGVSPRAVTELSDGSFAFLSAVRMSNHTYPEHLSVTKTDASGNPLWSTVFYSEYLEQPHDMVANDQDDLFVVGQAYAIESEWDGFLLKLDRDGNRQFDVFYDAGTFQGEIFRDVVINETPTEGLDAEVLILGDAGGFSERNISMLSVNEGNGAIQWSHQYPMSPMFTNYPADMYLSFNDGVVFTGDVRPPTYFRDAALFRTDASGRIACFTSPISYSRYTSVFEELSEEMVVNDLTNVQRTTFAFVEPFDPITEKVVCEDPGPVAFVSYEMENECPSVCVNFQSENLGDPTAWFWEFEGATTQQSYDANPTGICYNQPGTYPVRLTVTNTEGSSTFESTVIIPETDCPLSEIPNVFTPNGDNVNDVFEFKGLSGDFHFSIVNRWGEVVFETKEPNVFWDGTNLKGQPVSEGVYFYQLVKGDQTKHGFIQLDR